jgi:hypothetical protein
MDQQELDNMKIEDYKEINKKFNNNMSEELIKQSIEIQNFGKPGDFIKYLGIKMIIYRYTYSYKGIITGIYCEYVNNNNDIKSKAFYYKDLEFIKHC